MKREGMVKLTTAVHTMQAAHSSAPLPAVATTTPVGPVAEIISSCEKRKASISQDAHQ